MTPNPERTMQALSMDYQLTIPAILRRTRQLYGDKPVSSRRPDGSVRRTTYGELLGRAARLGGALQRLGVGAGDVIATLCWNHDRHLEAYYAVPCIGAVLHTLNLRLHPDELAYIANDAGDTVLIVDADLIPVLQQFQVRAPFTQVIVIGDGATPLPPGMLDYDTLLDDSDAIDLSGEAIAESSPAAMCYTSGTTGRPKGVVYSHRALTLHSYALGMTDSFGLRESDVVLPVVPMFHANAWGIPYGAALVGAGLVLPGKQLDPRSLCQLFASERVTFTAGVPTIWIGLLHLLDAARGEFDLSSIRLMLIGGAAVPESLLRGFAERHGIEVLQAWGMTELAPMGTVARLPSRLAALPPDECYRARTRQGTPAAFMEIRAQGDAGLIPWDDRAVGELQVRGPWVASGYHGSGAGDASFTDDGWFRTGDVVSIEPHGSIQIRDRAKDLVKSGGEWISSVALETGLMCHPAVLEAAVIAVPHPRWQERPLAAVVLRPGQSSTPEELTSHLAASFTNWWLPDAIVFLDALPKTGTGKFLKTALRDRFKDYYTSA
jgi:fatty-acyl-CoA synthase